MKKTGPADQLGRLSVTYAHPDVAVGGAYACQALGVDAHGRASVLTAAAHVAVAPPTTDQLAALLMQLTVWRLFVCLIVCLFVCFFPLKQVMRILVYNFQISSL